MYRVSYLIFVENKKVVYKLSINKSSVSSCGVVHAHVYICMYIFVKILILCHICHCMNVCMYE